jgi:hypothetical protein
VVFGPTHHVGLVGGGQDVGRDVVVEPGVEGPLRVSVGVGVGAVGDPPGLRRRGLAKRHPREDGDRDPALPRDPRR